LYSNRISIRSKFPSTSLRWHMAQTICEVLMTGCDVLISNAAKIVKGTCSSILSLSLERAHFKNNITLMIVTMQ